MDDASVDASDGSGGLSILNLTSECVDSSKRVSGSI
jgi:hypothetical protein